MGGLFATQTHSSRPMIPSSWTWRLTRSPSSSSLMLEMLWWWLEGETEDVLESLRTERSIRVALKLSTSRMLLVMSLQLVLEMCSPLARVQSHGFLFPRARVLNYPSLRRQGRDKPWRLQQPPNDDKLHASLPYGFRKFTRWKFCSLTLLWLLVRFSCLVILVIIKFLSRNTGFNFSFVTKRVTLLFYQRQYYWQWIFGPKWLTFLFFCRCVLRSKSLLIILLLDYFIN